MNSIFVDVQTNSNNLKTACAIAFSIAVFDHHSEVAYMQGLVKPVFVLSPKETTRSGYSNEDLRNESPFVDYIPKIMELLRNGKVHFYDSLSERVWRKSFREIGISLNESSNILQRSLIAYSKTFKGQHFGDTVQSFLPETTLNRNGLNARLLAELHTVLNEKDILGEYAFAKAESSKQLSKELYTELPATHGVYYFRDNKGEVIYVGKAINIRKRVASHLKSALPFERELTSKTVSVDYYETGNELIALLKESAEINDLTPKYNTQQISSINPWVIESRLDSKGVRRLNAKEKVYSDSNHTISFNRESVLEKLKMLQLLFNLCPRFLGLERTSGSCTYSKCKGICRNEESKNYYNSRVTKAFESLAKKSETYYLKLRGRNAGEMAFVLVQEGLYLGYGYIPKFVTISSAIDLEAFLSPQKNTYFTSRSIYQFINSNTSAKHTI